MKILSLLIIMAVIHCSDNPIESAIPSKGRLAVSDGNDVYIFESDGKFQQRPYNGMQGERIEGNWIISEIDPRCFVITGRVGGINRLTENGEYVKMKIILFPLQSPNKYIPYDDLDGVTEVWHIKSEIIEKTRIHLKD